MMASPTLRYCTVATGQTSPPLGGQVSLKRFCVNARQSFQTLKWNILFKNLQISSFYFKEQSPKRKFKLTNFIIFLDPQNGQNCFWHGQSNFYFIF